MPRLICLLISSLCTVASAAPPTVEQVSAALDIAEQAAQHQLTELSLNAVSRALRFGLPTLSTTTLPTSIPHRGARVDTSAPLPVPPVEALRQRVPGAVLQLVDAWRQQTTAEQIYPALRSVVLPQERPHEIFLYARKVTNNELQPERMPAVNSVAHALVRTAADAGMLPDLQQQLTTAGAAHVAEGGLLLLMCAVQQQDHDAILQSSVVLARQLQAGVRRETALVAADVGRTLRRSGNNVEAAANLLSAAARTLATIDQHDLTSKAPVTAVLLAASRSSFVADRQADAVELLQLVLENADPATGFNKKPPEASSRLRQLVARELFARHLNSQAELLLGSSEANRFARRYQTASWMPSAASSSPASDPEVNDSPPPVVESADPPLRVARIVPASAGASRSDVAAHIWFCSLNTETHESTLLFTLPDFQHVRSPCVSADGQRVAFDATFPGEPLPSAAAIYTARLDGSDLQRLGPGTQPSWSPGATRLVCNRYSPDRGVWIVRSDGSGEVLLDSAGWSSQWSPDGVRIAYTRSSGDSSEFVTYNVVEDSFSVVATGKKVSPAQSSWNYCWTTDSQQLLVEATLAGTAQAEPEAFARVTVTGAGDVPRLVRGTDEWDAEFQRVPGSGDIVFAKKTQSSDGEQLLQLSPRADSSSEPLVGQEVDRRNTGLSWLNDGRTLIYVSRPRKPGR